MLICINKKTGEVVPDFQSRATEGTLIKNAVNAGFGVAEDFEEIQVTEERFGQELDAFQLSKKPERDATEKKRKDDFKSLKKKLKDLGLNGDEIGLLVPYAD